MPELHEDLTHQERIDYIRQEAVKLVDLANKMRVSLLISAIQPLADRGDATVTVWSPA